MHKSIPIVVGITILFLGTCITPSVAIDTIEQSSMPISDKSVIIVDDEGDGDYTSIKEAVNNASSGDTIEVYSGTYLEQGIHIENDNIELLGISHELGEGDDSGKPFIKGDGTIAAIWVGASHAIVSNFTIENPYNHTYYHTGGIYVGKDYPPFEQEDIIISDCIIYNTTWGIYDTDAENIRIINNNISHCINGIDIDFSMNFLTTGNVITDCRDCGIFLYGPIFNRNFSGNRIRNCKFGIDFGGENNIFYGNDIENCSLGIRFSGDGNIFTKNNFKNYSQKYNPFNGSWFYKFFLFPTRNSWTSNYWDTWKGVGPKIILGSFAVGWRLIPNMPLFIPWIDFDWHPALKPYDI